MFMDSPSAELEQLQLELETATQKPQEMQTDADNHQEELVALQQKLQETEAALKELQATDLAANYAAAKFEIADLKTKMDEIKVEKDTKIAELKQQLEATETEKEKDSKYAELKKQLRSAKFRHDIDGQIRLLLFGPPGTGKTMIGKAIASESGATIFYISASSIASKWAGESEQLVCALFALATAKQPSVIFIDEIDSKLTKRSDDEAGHRRAIKTEFMVQLDGMTSSGGSVLVIGATNCPHTLDEAIRRRFVKRMYIPLPATAARTEFMRHALKDTKHALTLEEFPRVTEATDRFSCADMQTLCTEAALGPVREITDIRSVIAADIRAIAYGDFVQALGNVKSSVGGKDLKLFDDWNAAFGSFPV